MRLRASAVSVFLAVLLFPQLARAHATGLVEGLIGGVVGGFVLSLAAKALLARLLGGTIRAQHWAKFVAVAFIEVAAGLLSLYFWLDSDYEHLLIWTTYLALTFLPNLFLLKESSQPLPLRSFGKLMGAFGLSFLGPACFVVSGWFTLEFLL